MSTEDIDRARRDYETAAGKVGKIGYLAGNGAEKQSSMLYHKFVNLNNADPSRPFVILPKKKYRRG